MKIGFTGNQDGMSDKQHEAVVRHVVEWYKLYDKLEIHHGDCIGSDAEFHEIVRKYAPCAFIVGHPPINPNKRAFCKCDLFMPEKDYIPRNHDIVIASEVLWATPKQTQEVLRSGTWATIRYNRKLRHLEMIFTP